MEKKLEVREEFIKAAHAAACSERETKIEKEFPSVFDDSDKRGKWCVKPHCGAGSNEVLLFVPVVVGNGGTTALHKGNGAPLCLDYNWVEDHIPICRVATTLELEEYFNRKLFL